MTLEDLAAFPTFAKMKREFDKIKEQAHSDYIKLPINTYGHNLDIMVEAKAKERALQKIEVECCEAVNKQLILNK
jgi:hypothetical protein